jgi:hypothetical protein
MAWKLSEAGPLVRELEERVAHAEGFMLGIYGSTLEGSGADLDVLAVPWRPGTSPAHLLAALAGYLGAKTGPAYVGQIGTYSAVLTLEDGRLLDVQVRPAPRDAECTWRSE